MRTRQQYLNGECTYKEYYAQFVTESHINKVVSIVGKDKLLNSTDKNLNDIPLIIWDRIMAPVGTSNKMKEVGDSLTLAGQVCINKSSARQFIKNHNSNL